MQPEKQLVAYILLGFHSAVHIGADCNKLYCIVLYNHSRLSCGPLVLHVYTTISTINNISASTACVRCLQQYNSAHHTMSEVG